MRMFSGNKTVLLIIVFFLYCYQAQSRIVTIETGVLVSGGTAGGTTAAIQAARCGVPVVIVEPTPWFGGMLTMAGVSATDGNHFLPSGIWGEFRNHLYDYYGGEKAVFTGWVSNTQFEPHIGNRIFTEMVSHEDRIIAIHGYHVVKCLLSGKRVEGAVFINESATDTLTVRAKVTVDATETGDLMALAGCNYFIGQDSKEMTGESGAPEEATDIIQDMTFVAILKDYGPNADKSISMPDNYDPSLYDCTCNCSCTDSSKMRYTCESALGYGKLPNNKYMINWPYRGNDFYLNDLEMDYYTREKEWKKAKDHTLGWIYFMQTKGGYKNLGLADDEFPTEDHLAFYPYYRESRRLDGIIQLHNGDLVDPYRDTERQLYKSAISVGDYPLDLHHVKMPVKIKYSVEKIPSFSVPYGCLVPKTINGLIVAEKSISVSHIVNGCTRLQPSVMCIGQAAGDAAALCVKHNIEPREINIRELQQDLLNAGCWLLPYPDVPACSDYFQPVQRVALCGIMRGEPVTEGWANKTYFHPDDAVTKTEIASIISILKGENACPVDFASIKNDKSAISRKSALLSLWKIYPAKNESKMQDLSGIINFVNSLMKSSLKIDPAEIDKSITRKELACWIDILFKPFLNERQDHLR